MAMGHEDQEKINFSYSIYMAVATIPISLLFLIFGEHLANKWIVSYKK